jgi:hypothetical protein
MLLMTFFVLVFGNLLHVSGALDLLDVRVHTVCTFAVPLQFMVLACAN